MRILFVLFVILPILEMYVLIKVGALIGAMPTIGLVLLTAVIGAALLRRQGLSTLQRAQWRMQVGELPAEEMVEGFALAVAGVLMLTPGFITDAMGLFLLVPPTRKLLIRYFLARVTVVQASGGNAAGRKNDSHTIEGEYRRDD